MPRPAVGAADETTAVWEKTSVSVWQRLVTTDQGDRRAFLLATAYQQWIPPPLRVTPRSPVVFPSKEG